MANRTGSESLRRTDFWAHLRGSFYVGLIEVGRSSPKCRQHCPRSWRPGQSKREKVGEPSPHCYVPPPSKRWVCRCLRLWLPRRLCHDECFLKVWVETNPPFLKLILSGIFWEPWTPPFVSFCAPEISIFFFLAATRSPDSGWNTGCPVTLNFR